MKEGVWIPRIVQIIVALAMALYLMHLPTLPSSQPEVQIIEVRITPGE